MNGAPHAARVVRVAVPWTLGGDANDPHRLARFWGAALGYVPEPGFDEEDAASIVDPDGVGPAISWLRVREGKTSKNRLHIDVRVAGEPPWDVVARASLIDDKVTELVAAGATVVRRELYRDAAGHEALGHVVMLDPEGNEFCVA